MQLNLVERLHGIEGATLGLAVQLAQVDTERAVEEEGVLAHRLATGQRRAHTVEAELVLDRPVEQVLAQTVHQPLGQAGRLAFELQALHFHTQVDEVVEDALLQRGGVFHAHTDRRQQVVPAARRREVQGGRDLAQVAQHGLLPFGDVDGEAQRDPGRHGHREIADPGHR